MQLPAKMSHRSQTLDSALKIYKGWKYSANLTSDGAITTSVSKKVTNGKEHSKHAADFLNQKSCSLACLTLQPASNDS